MAMVVKADPNTDLYMDTYEKINFVGTRAEMLDYLTSEDPRTTGTTPEEHLAHADQFGSNMRATSRGHWDDSDGFAWPHDNRWLPRMRLTEFLRAYQRGGWPLAATLLEPHPTDR